jgi:hypothetical protein
MKPIGAAQLNRIFNNFFGKNLGSQLLRHIFISSKFRDGGTYREMKETARDMGHSIQQQQEEYLKSDEEEDEYEQLQQKKNQKQVKKRKKNDSTSSRGSTHFLDNRN